MTSQGIVVLSSHKVCERDYLLVLSLLKIFVKERISAASFRLYSKVCLGWSVEIGLRPVKSQGIFVTLGRVVRKPINANPRLKGNRGFHLAH